MRNQADAPIMQALEKLQGMRVVPFDVPGHKRGRGNAELTDFLGRKCMAIDVNSMKPLDNLCHPVSVIRDAEELAAEAFGAAHAFFMVGGTTSAVEAMILSVCKRGDKIILPRNVHRSAINALILCGAVPVYVDPGTDEHLGISLGMRLPALREAVEGNPGAKAIFVNNPTYYGVCSNLKEIVQIAHAHGMKALVDEAHGAHFYFGAGMPLSAMAAGADLAAVSMHKSGGSLTQSSFLLAGPGVNLGYLRQVINLTQTTSASYLLLSSLDISRKKMALDGLEIFKKVTAMAEYARAEINRVGDYYAFGREIIDGDSVFDFDPTKLSVNTVNLGLAGVEVYDLLRDEYDIQIEFGDMSNFLAYISVGDTPQNIERLVGALSEIRRLYRKAKGGKLHYEYISPEVVMTPQDAFYAERRAVPIEKSAGLVSGESLMCYPPGIPILSPGERISAQIVEYILYAKEKGSFLTGTEDLDVKNINVLAGR
ncbi:MAG: aminotransferase class I/II-fold pyridoxal phosphate-dependent enzyme [Christensenellaceae bacterium]|nr:aminotransferase class I/II-fold pyridoxal phosphate-dependent enzyme [Christensenellaceae bacterium]